MRNFIVVPDNDSDNRIAGSMLKTRLNFVNRRRSAVIIILVAIVTASFFMIPVSNRVLTSQSWCGLGSYGAVELTFSKDGTFLLIETQADNFGSSYYESGIWMRDGWSRLEMSLTRSLNPLSQQYTFQIRPFGWGLGLQGGGSSSDANTNSRTLIVTRCKSWLTRPSINQ